MMGDVYDCHTRIRLNRNITDWIPKLAYYDCTLNEDSYHSQEIKTSTYV